jgi:DNA-binding NarL/FixJ family response regulator
MRRVFQNSYSYRGTLRRVRGWSVKIQYQGHRRTFSLHSKDRIAAAEEAARLYQEIITEGWPPRKNPDATTPSLRIGSPEMTRSFWQQRLMRRPYPVSAGTSPWVARMEHEGSSALFVLDSRRRETASAQALAIFRAVVKDGWETTLQKQRREITVGFQWSTHPVMWSYTTFHTDLIEANPADAKKSSALSVVIVEPDSGVRRALKRLVNAHSNAACIAAYSGMEISQLHCPRRGELWLLNQNLPKGNARHYLERLQPHAPGFASLVFSVYEDSNQLFLAAPGGVSGYHLRRSRPEQFLEPLMPLSVPLSASRVLARAKVFFQTSLTTAQSDEPWLLEDLTARENEILQLLSKGHVDKEIAGRLGISAWTVHTHVKNIFEKLDVHTRTEAVAKYLQK